MNTSVFRLSGFGAAILLLNVVGFGWLIFGVAPHVPAMLGLGVLAYTLGLRHAFDADHIAAIDNTTRKLMRDGKRPYGTGFFFSLGHSTIVFLMVVALAVATKIVARAVPSLEHLGNILGTLISGAFLYVISFMNILVLLGLIAFARSYRQGQVKSEDLDVQLANRGFISRFAKPLFNMISESWNMYPIGVLFGLGFDTASEVALLAISAGVASSSRVPVYDVIVLPVLFAAGMSLMDTADGVFMLHAYKWAFSSAARKLFYNIVMTGLSIFIALFVGTVEIVQVALSEVGATGAVASFIENLPFSTMGFIIVGMFILTWSLAILAWKAGNVEQLLSRRSR